EQRRTDEIERQPGCAADIGCVGRYGQAARAGSRMDGACGQGGRQLRRDVRAQCRLEVAVEAAARTERAVEQGWNSVRTADPLTQSVLDKLGCGSPPPPGGG